MLSKYISYIDGLTTLSITSTGARIISCVTPPPRFQSLCGIKHSNEREVILKTKNNDNVDATLQIYLLIQNVLDILQLREIHIEE